MIRTNPLRRMTLQLRQIFLTEARTFMSSPLYLNRYVIRPLVRS